MLFLVQNLSFFFSFCLKWNRGGMNRNLPWAACSHAGGLLAARLTQPWQGTVPGSTQPLPAIPAGSPGVCWGRTAKQRGLKIHLHQDLAMVWCLNPFVLCRSLRGCALGLSAAGGERSGEGRR